MAANSSAHPARAGFNQSGGAYFLVVSSIAAQLNSYSGGSGSGGATTVGTFTLATTGASVSSIGLTGDYSSLVGIGALVKDLGKTVVSSGRTFRKFQLVQPTATNSSITGGVMGLSPTYASFYLETGRDGAGSGLPRIARYM